MNPRVKEHVDRWLDEAADAMGGDSGARRDALLELETTIYERVDERTQTGRLPEEAVQDVLDHMGDAFEVGQQFVPMRPLLDARHTRSFLVNTLCLFALHFMAVLGATMAGRALTLPPFRILPLASTSFLEVLARATETLLFDAGAVLAVFLLADRIAFLRRRLFRHRLGVRPDHRHCIEAAAFLALVLLVLNVFRDDLFALYVTYPGGTHHLPLAGDGVLGNLFLLNAWIGLAIARELLYRFRGENRFTISFDIVSNAIGVFCLLRMAATREMVDLTQATDALGTAADTVSSLLNFAFMVIAIATAALLSGRIVRRGFRLRLLRGTEL